ncbi:hypothetical protein HY212_06315 [Candidatus Pacearchaeota archaeon]|nr:hypothetical protein [Candidatus Pacearchaeota archaeon]
MDKNNLDIGELERRAIELLNEFSDQVVEFTNLSENTASILRERFRTYDVLDVKSTVTLVGPGNVPYYTIHVSNIGE